MHPVSVSTPTYLRQLLPLVAATLIAAVSVVDAQPIMFPPDSLFRPGVVTVTFDQRAVIPEYFCTPGRAFPKTTSEESFINPTTELIGDTAIVDYLNNKGATLEPGWPPCYDPCPMTQTPEVTQWGDTLHFPIATEYTVHFPDTINPAQFAYELVTVNDRMIVSTGPIAAVSTLYYTTTIPTDPFYDGIINKQYSLFDLPSTSYWGINIEKAYDITMGSEGVRMACLDGGFEPEHEDFWGWNGYTLPPAYETNVASSVNFALKDNFGAFSVPIYGDWHGLFVSGIMGALTNNVANGGAPRGVAGVAGGNWGNGLTSPIKGPRLYLGQMTYHNDLPGGAHVNQIHPEISALETWAPSSDCNSNVRVFNMSFIRSNTGGTSYLPSTIPLAGLNLDYYISLAKAYRRCVVMVNSLIEDDWRGNTDPIEGEWKYWLPGGLNDQWFIGVAASRGSDGAKSDESAWGSGVDVMAPGTGGHVFGLAASNGYVYNGSSAPTSPDATSATSWAAPHVSGTAALILSVDNTLLNDDVQGLIQGTAKKAFYREGSPPVKLGQAEPFDPHTGYGVIDAGAAVEKAGHVHHDKIDLGAITDEDDYNTYYSAHVTETYLDNDWVPYATTSTTGPAMIVRNTDENDPFKMDPQPFYKYEFRRLKVTINDVIAPDDPATIDPDQLGHVWGIGLGHGLIADTKGWEPGPVAFGKNDQGGDIAVRWCSETPYAKVENPRYDANNRKFSLSTYLYFIKTTNTSVTPPAVSYTWYPTNTRNVSISYGYYNGPPTWSVEEGTATPTALALANISPNPSSTPGNLVLQLKVATPDEYRIEICDVLSNQVIEPYSLGRMEVGIYRLPLSLPDVPAGTYYCRVQASRNNIITGIPFTIVR